MVVTIIGKTKGNVKERLKDWQPIGTKEGRELVPLMIGSYLTHSLCIVAYMQIMRSNKNRRFRISNGIIYPVNIILFSIAKVKAR
jgi:hypothetical protein